MCSKRRFKGRSAYWESGWGCLMFRVTWYLGTYAVFSKQYPVNHASFHLSWRFPDFSPSYVCIQRTLHSLTWCYHTPHPRAGPQGSRQPCGLELSDLPAPSADSLILPILTHPWWFSGSHLPAPFCPVLLQTAGPLRGLCTQIWFDFCSFCFLPWPWPVPYLTRASSLTHAELRIGYRHATSCLKLGLHRMAIVILWYLKTETKLRLPAFHKMGRLAAQELGYKQPSLLSGTLLPYLTDITVSCHPPFLLHYD